MWEVIVSNRRKSVVLVSVMGTLMVGAGMLIGEAVAPGAYMVGGAAALLLWALLTAVSYYGGSSILLASAGARQIQKEDHPTLFNIVEEMCIASGLSNMPKVYIINDSRPNAFATGRDPEHASIAVTAGLLNRLNRDEVQGVVAHELAHVQNRDVLYVMIAAVMVGVIALMADVFLRMMLYGGGRYRSRSRGRDQSQAVILVVALLFAILGPISAQLLYLALSRRREYLADACAAQFTRYPEGLASALEKIAADPGMAEQKNRALAPMYIINPLQGAMSAVGLFSTHPPTEQRIRVLRSMSGAALADYEEAYRKAGHGSLVPWSGMQASRPVGVRPAWEEEPAKPGTRERARETADMLWKLNRYAFIPCACGARLKVPPGFKAPNVRCPRCERMHEIPRE